MHTLALMHYYTTRGSKPVNNKVVVTKYTNRG